MSIRRMLQIGVVSLALGGAVVPFFGTSEAQVTTDTDRTATTADDRGGHDWGWVGIFGLAGLAGLMGNKRETTSTTSRNPSTATAR